MELRDYHVGQRYPNWATGGDIVQADFGDGLWTLTIGFPGITPEEIQNIQLGHAQFAFADVEDCLFLLVKFGAFDWMDAPYEPRLYPEPQEYINFEHGDGAPLLVFSVDTNTGELKAMRILGLGNVLSNRLHAVCREKDARRPLDTEAYSKKVSQLYRRFPSSAQLLNKVKLSDVFMLIDQTDQPE